MAGKAVGNRVGFSHVRPLLDLLLPALIADGEGQREEEEMETNRSVVLAWSEVAGVGRKIRVGSAGNCGSSGLGRISGNFLFFFLKNGTSIYRKNPK